MYSKSNAQILFSERSAQKYHHEKTFVEGKKRTLQITLTSTNQPTMDIILGIKVSTAPLLQHLKLPQEVFQF